jgi:SAM-dependent methyltransferase
VTAAHAADLLGAAMVDFAAGRRTQAWLRVAPGRRLAHDLAAYFAPVTAHERALLDLVEGPVLDVGCGPARHARLLQARGLTVIGLDRSLLALELAQSLGLRHWLHADALSGSLPSVRTALLLDGNLGLAGTPEGAVRLLHRLAMVCGPGGQLLVGGRAPAMGGCGPWSSGTNTWAPSDPGGGGCRPASRPSSTWPTRLAGDSNTPRRPGHGTGSP